MPENPLDHIIRQKLDSFQVPFQEFHWSEFAREYLAPDTSHTIDDSFFQEALSSLTISPSEGDWELFERSLPVMDVPVIDMTTDHDAPAFSEDEALTESIDDFPDDLFREKLLLEELPYEEGDWEQMAHQLDGNLFDQAIRSRLHSYTLPLSSTDWYDMSSQIDAPMYASFKEHLGAMEVSYRHSDWKLFARKWLGYNPWYTEWRNLASMAAVLLLLFSALSPSFLPSRSTPTYTVIEVPTDETIDSGSPVTVENQSSEVAPDLVSSTPPNSLREYTPPYIATGSVSTRIRQIASTLQVAEDEQGLAEQSVFIQPDESQPATHIHKISPRKVSWNEFGFPTKAPYWTEWFTPRNHLTSLSIGPYASLGKTRAELNSTYRTPGFAAGVRVELGITEELSLITGLQYERRGFSHRFFSYSPTLERVENIIDADMQLAEIPLLLRYYMPASPKVRLYGQTGLVTMVSLKEEYQLYQNAGAGFPIPDTDRANLRLADPTEGQQRSLETYTGNIYGGFGISVQATERISVEAEPYLLLSLQKTKGSGALGVEKRMYHGGVGFSISYQLK